MRKNSGRIVKGRGGRRWWRGGGGGGGARGRLWGRTGFSVQEKSQSVSRSMPTHLCAR